MFNQKNDKSPSGLFARLQGIPENELSERIRATEGLTEDDFDRFKKFSDHWKNFHWNECRKIITTATSLCIGGVIIFSSGAIIALMGKYIYNTWGDAAEIKNLLASLKEWVLLGLSVLFLESKLKKE